MLENIMPILQNENKANVKSIALLLTQGFKDPIDLPGATQLRQIDPNFKIFILGLRPAGKDYNLKFWEKFATSLNGSSRNEVTNTDFYELANSKESVMTALTKFQKAMAIERSIPLTKGEPKPQSLRTSLSGVAARENNVQTTINKNRNLIVQSKSKMSKHKESSQDQMQMSVLKNLEANMNELTHKIDEYQQTITQDEDQEKILKEKISEMSNVIHKQQTTFKEFLRRQEQYEELTETQKQALEQVKHALEDYSAQKIDVTEHMNRLKSTLLMIENLSTSDDSMNLRFQTRNQLHDVLSLVQ